MKTLNWIALCSMLTTGPLHAQEGKFVTCEDVGGMQKVLAKDDFLLAQTCLDHFEFSKEAAKIEQEANLVAKMCAKFIPLDKEGGTDENCYGIYNSNPTAMAAAWDLLTPKQHAVVKKSYDQTASVQKHGNGGGNADGAQLSPCDVNPSCGAKTPLSPTALKSLVRVPTPRPAPVKNS